MVMEIAGVKIPCGCEQRKEIMGAGEWQKDAILLGIIILVPALVVLQKRYM